jgi:8-oxo-dGTP pyrophosphatase MutT (NUDIX family)
MHDKNDESLLGTALRETWEEMGIHSDDIYILGYADNFLTNTNFMVTPFVGYFPYPYDYTINHDEIAQVIEVPISFLLNPDIFEIQRWERNGILWDLHFYHYNSEPIWGVTGFLLSNFLSIVFGLPHIPDFERDTIKAVEKSHKK